MMVSNQDLRNKWVGLIEVKQLDGVKMLGENRGAHVTAIAWCKDKADYEVMVENALADNGLKLIESEEIESIEERIKNYDVDDEFVDAVGQVSQQNPVVFMSFHTFPLDDD